jgi:hypothetical protein
LIVEWTMGTPNAFAVQEEEQQNEDLLRLSTRILELTKAIHAMNLARSPTNRDGA